MTVYLRSSDRCFNPNGTPTPYFLDQWNRLVDQLGGQGRDSIKDIQTGNLTIDPVISGQGRLSDVLNAQSESIADANATTSTATGALTASASPANGYGTENAQITVTANGGSGPYSYAWTVNSGNFAFDDVTVNNPVISRSSGFTAASGEVQCVVTDSLAATKTVKVAIYLEDTTAREPSGPIR